MYNSGILMFKSAIGTVTSPMTDSDVDYFVESLDKAIVESGLA
jgi:glutamate-1-semialdehyde 2,1-aminomutase